MSWKHARAPALALVTLGVAAGLLAAQDVPGAPPAARATATARIGSSACPVSSFAGFVYAAAEVRFCTAPAPGGTSSVGLTAGTGVGRIAVDGTLASQDPTHSGATVASNVSTFWRDVVYWTKPGVTTVVFRLALDSRINVGVTGPWLTDLNGAVVQSVMDFWGPYVDGANPAYQSTATIGIGGFPGANPRLTNPRVAVHRGNFTFWVPTAGQQSLPFAYSWDISGLAAGQAFGNYRGTLSLTTVELLGPNGHAVPKVGPHFMNGTVTTNPVVPEPSVLTLLGTGLAGLGGWARLGRRRRREARPEQG